MANKLTDEEFAAQMAKLTQLHNQAIGYDPKAQIDSMNNQEYGQPVSPPTQMTQPVDNTGFMDTLGDSLTTSLRNPVDSLLGSFDMLGKGTSDIVRSVPGAYSRTMNNMQKFGKTVGNVVMDEEYFDENKGDFITPTTPDYNYPAVGEGSEVMLSYLGGMGGGVKLASQAPNLVKYISAIAGGTTTTDPTEGNLSSLIQSTDYRNTLTEFLMADTNAESSSLEKLQTYGKNFLEEGLFGAPIDAGIIGYQAIKNNPEIKQKILEELGSFANKAEEMAGRIPGVETEKTVAKDVVAFHNSPHKFDEIDPSKQQEGLMGKGHYVFLNKEGADDYPGAYKYTQEIPDDVRDRVINFGDGKNSSLVDTAFENIGKTTGLQFDGFRPSNYFELIESVGQDKAHALLRQEGIIGNLTDIGTSSKPDAVMMYSPEDVQLLTRNGDSLVTPPVSGRLPSEMGISNMTESERKVSNEMNSSLPYKEPDDFSGLQDLLDAAENKNTRIALNEQKADVKAQAQVAQQTQYDAKPKAPIDELGFYSKAEQVILDLKQETNTPDDIKRYLNKNGVTNSELQDTGLLGMLNTKKESGERVTKTGLLDHIQTNKTKLDETQHLGGSDDMEYDDAYYDATSNLELDDPTYGNTNTDNSNYIIQENEHLETQVEEFMEYNIPDGDIYNEDYDEIFDAMISMPGDSYRHPNYPIFNEIEKLDKKITEISRRTTADGGLSLQDYAEREAVYDQRDALKETLRNSYKREDLLKDEVIPWWNEVEGALESGDLSTLPAAVREDVESAVRSMLDTRYEESPYYEWDVSLGNNSYTATGNDEVGIHVIGPNGQSIGSYDDRHAAEMGIRQNAVDGGYMDDFIAEQGISGSGSTKYADYTQGGLDSDSYREIPITTNPLGVEDYRGGHMDEDNTVAHLRLSDKVDEDGKRVLFIEELQSDWHQQGRKGGYSTKDNQRKVMKLETEADRLKRDYESSMTYDEGEKIRNRLAEIEKEKVKLSGVVPDAPLKGSKWQQMGFKRAMKIASDEGYDRVAWTTSEQQLNLYNPKNSDGVRRLDSKGKVQYKELYENLYDKKLTSYSKKYASKNGSQTGKVEIDFNGTTEVNYIDVTPKLKAKLKEKGQSSYSVAPIAPIAGGGLLATQQEKPKNGLLD